MEIFVGNLNLCEFLWILKAKLIFWDLLTNNTIRIGYLVLAMSELVN